MLNVKPLKIINILLNQILIRFNKMSAQSQIAVLKDEPINLTLSLVVNILSIATIIEGLCINNVKFSGFHYLNVE